MLTHLTLAAMAERIRGRELSPVELLEAHLAQIDKHNPTVNAFVIVLADEARRAARFAEQRVMSGESLGALHGIPLTIKDSFDMEGLATTCGSRFFAKLPARYDSTVIRRLRQAGAILLGKTNTPEFLASYETDNYLTGRTNNPWDESRTPGGSSGGESAAIAAFMSAGGIGSDGGGSIRVPAHFTGIAGLKPTPGRVPSTGHVPVMNHPSGLVGVAGPMARTATDLRLLFEAVAGYDAYDPFSAPVPLARPQVGGTRIGVMEQFLTTPVQPAVRTTVQRAAVALQDLGFAVDSFTPSGIDRAPNMWWFLFGELPARITQELIAGREQDAHWTATEFMTDALKRPEPTSRRVLDVLAERDRLRCVLLKQMETFPVVLLPVCGVTAFKHQERRWSTDGKDIGLFEAMMPATPFNLMGMPGVTIPFGMSPEGLPVGIQLVGRPYEDELLLELAVRLEQVRGPFASPPGY